jgi:hypothetical protein
MRSLAARLSYRQASKLILTRLVASVHDRDERFAELEEDGFNEQSI